ncbi:MAG: SDR family NAD(P)-dependent oxidoreductase, partial [Deltaproteobacteria bacterium]|nr:SDR family NAD(P)-dependent oxidoreductase [Deltaproteobacteria bacterium]
MRLKNQVAVVTGGGGGLGEGICLCLAGQGADVIVSDVKQELADKVAAKVKEQGRKSLAVRTDVRKADECRALIDTALKEMDRLDILVCCAGVSGASL